MDFKNSKIYKIVNDENDNFYIGSTCSTLTKRMYGHRNKKNQCTSRKLGVDLKDCKIVLVEAFECKNKDELFKKERFYIEKYRNEGLPILNRKLPGRSKKEYVEDTKEKKKEYNKINHKKIIKKHNEWANNNPEKMKEYRNRQKEYLIKNPNKAKQYQETKDKYYENNKEKLNKDAIKRYIKNKTKILARLNKKITCDCGSIVSSCNLKRHQLSKIHINFLHSK